MLASTFGVPMKSMKKYLDLPQDQQDAVLKNEGIPTDSIDNQFKAWVRNARAVNSDLRIAIKADGQYSLFRNKKCDELTSGPQREPVQPDYFSEDHK